MPDMESVNASEPVTAETNIDGGFSEADDTHSEGEECHDGFAMQSTMTMSATTSSAEVKFAARDSDFGLSDRQLKHLWVQWEQRGHCLQRRLTEESFDQDSDLDSDFGLSDSQLEQLRKVTPRLSQKMVAQLSVKSIDALSPRQPSSARLAAATQSTTAGDEDSKYSSTEESDDVGETAAAAESSSVIASQPSVESPIPTAAGNSEVVPPCALPSCTGPAASAAASAAPTLGCEAASALQGYAAAVANVDSAPGYETSTPPAAAAAAAVATDCVAVADRRPAPSPVAPVESAPAAPASATPESAAPSTRVVSLASLPEQLGGPDSVLGGPCLTLGEFLGEKTPPSGSRWKAMVLSSNSLADGVWYLLKVVDFGDERYYMKQYCDFCRLDRALRREFRQSMNAAAVAAGAQEDAATSPARASKARASRHIMASSYHANHDGASNGTAAGVGQKVLAPPPSLPAENSFDQVLPAMQALRDRSSMVVGKLLGRLRGGAPDAPVENLDNKSEPANGNPHKGQILQTYFTSLEKQVHELSDRPALAEFFAKDSPTRVWPRANLDTAPV